MGFKTEKWYFQPIKSQNKNILTVGTANLAIKISAQNTFMAPEQIFRISSVVGECDGIPLPMKSSFQQGAVLDWKYCLLQLKSAEMIQFPVMYFQRMVYDGHCLLWGVLYNWHIVITTSELKSGGQINIILNTIGMLW